MIKILKVFNLTIIEFLLFASCSQELKNEYPIIATQNFMNSCQRSGGSQDNCACMLDKIQRKYTFQEFTPIEKKVNQNQSPKDFQEFVKLSKVECLIK